MIIVTKAPIFNIIYYMNIFRVTVKNCKYKVICLQAL